MYIIRYDYYSHEEQKFIRHEVVTDIKIPLVAIGGIAFFTNCIIKNFSYEKAVPKFCEKIPHLNDELIMNIFKEQFSSDD